MKHYLFTRIRAFSIILITLFSTSYLSAQTDCGCMGGATPATAVELNPDSNCMTQIDSTDLDDLTSCTGPYVFTVIQHTTGDTIIVGTDSVLVDLKPYIGDIIRVVVDPTGGGNGCFSFYEIIDDTAPVLTCPDISITCEEFPDSVGPVGVVEDCGIVTFATPVDSIGDVNCAAGPYRSVFRTYTADDGNGNITSCQQEVFILKSDTADVAFPPDTTLNCGSVFTDSITGRPTLNGVPFFNNSLCNLQLLVSEDIDTSGCGNLTIRREWTFIDDCDSDVLKQRTQVIDLIDTIPPVFSPCSSLFIFNADANCNANPVVPIPNVTDNCSDVTIQAFANNMQGVPTSGGFVFNGFTEGTYPLLFTATDACGFASTCSSSIQIVDVTTPTAVCEGQIAVTLNNNGTAMLFAFDVDDGSNDACGHPLDYQVSRDGLTNFVDFITFDCDDALADSIMITLQVIDLLNPSSTNICMTSVVVSDKAAPILVCPQPDTVDCGFDFSDLSVFGDPPVLMEACMFTVEMDSTFNISQCGTGTITRMWTVRDSSGNEAFCDQEIVIENQTPFDGTGIVFPQDYTVTNGCTDPTDLEPTALPSGFDMPTLPTDDCAMLATSYKDQLFYIDFPACYKIVRTWKVIDWCQATDPNGTVGVFRDQQVIAVMDTDPPTITSCPAPDTVGLNDDCTFGEVLLLPVTATGTCSNEDITITNDSPFAFANGANASGNYPEGVHTINFTVTDGCGNEATCSTTITVTDQKIPTLVCKDGIIGELAFMPNASPQIMAVISASQLIYSAADNCTAFNDLTFTMRTVGDTTAPVPSIVYDCAGEGSHDVEIYVTDQAGNQDLCITEVHIQDNMQLCNDDTLAVANGVIGGGIQTTSGEFFPEVHVDITDMNMTYMTDDQGLYEFQNLNVGGDYTVEPWNNSDPKNGVTTYDIVIITRHILGINAINSPLKLIAADINNSGSVTTFDVVELRKLILGIYADFPANSSWRFVKADYTFPNENAPSDPPFPEVANVNNLTNDVLNANFIGVKIGDVNGSASVSYDGVADSRSTENLNMLIEDRKIEAGEIFTVPFRLERENNLLALQFTLEFETDLELQGIEKGALASVAGDRFVTSLPGDGIMTGTWYHTTPVLATTEDALFNLRFQSKTSGMLSDLITMTSRITEAIVYDGQELPFNLNLEFSNPSNMQTNHAFQLHQNQPNPFKRFTNIAFTLPEAGPAKLVIYDVSGNLLKTYENTYQQGYNEVNIMRQELPTGGVLFYQLQTSSHTATKKMILLQ
ncbi:MAG: T9SS type A sorting domain-containing protein [Bacteroidota bacterium]